jgi:hypothetical protein
MIVLNSSLLMSSRKEKYSERQKYGINSLKIKQNFFQKIFWTGQF